jgi:hypothetical protein
LDEFSARKCVARQSAQLTNIDFRERLLPLGILYYVGCPLISDAGTPYGAVFLNWDDMAGVPPPADVDAVIRRVRLATTVIGNYYLHMR